MLRVVFSLLFVATVAVAWRLCVQAAEPQGWRAFREAREKASGAQEKAKLVRRFAETLVREGAPLCGADSITFVYVAEAGALPKDVRVKGDFTGWESWVSMQRFEDTPLYVRVLDGLPADARIEYKFSVDGKEMLDPLNPVRVDNGVGGENCVVALAGYRPYQFEGMDQDRLAGRLIRTEFRSRLAGNVRQVTVYTPPSYTTEPGRCYPSVYIHDGGSYLGYARTASIVDHLIAEGRIQEVILVFVDPVNRWKEYARDPLFTRVMLEEVVPSIDSVYRTRTEPGARCVLGASMGGLVTIHLAFGHPEVFGLAASQSGAFHRPDNTMLRDIGRAPRKALKIYADVGLYDLGDGKRGLLAESRSLRDVLQKKGYPLLYHEYAGGHNWTCWRDQLAVIFEYFFKK